ncbi:TPR-like protein [Dendrothele bispora CBS 962.96]|uniref:TPR-like protein n=1 Tax=Dendrothele bispora (strain CBS 962.96) TaxID=1314807 RepID=A0A4S8LHK4_DENBC|nr:TPR-like protein [Dendrothele bispora CBS 962.96]
MSKDTSLSSSSIVNRKYWILITLFRKLLFNMSESDTLPEGPMMNQAAAEAEETVTQSTSCYHEDEDAELHMAIRMSLEEPDAETTEDTMGDNMPIDREEQAELDQALFLSNLPPDMCDEQLAELNQARVNEANSARESGTKVEELNGFAMQLMEHFDQSRDCTAIQSAVQLMEDVIKLTPDGHMEKARRLSNLGTALQRQFECLGEFGDIEKAILVNQQAVDLTSDSDIDKAGMFNNLGNAFFRQFQCLGKLGDLENAILAKQKAVDLTPDDASKARQLSNLGSAFFNQFQCLGKLGDIENAILVNQQAVDLTPNGHAEKASRLTNLGNAFQSRFKHLGELGDIENAVLAMQQAVDLTPDGNADKARCLSNLGNSFSRRFESLGQLRDIENAIFVQQQAVDLTPDDHVDKAERLANLGSAFDSRFEHVGKLEDIENSILVLQQAVDMTPDGHTEKAGWLNTLGNAFESRFECLSKLTDIENAILVKQQAVDLTPDDHAFKAKQLNSLGLAFRLRFKHFGKLEDIDNAILVLKQAVDLTPDGHTYKAWWLNNLGVAFSSRFECLSELEDIENVILVMQKAVDLTPDGHTDKAGLLNNLGLAFRSRFDHVGKLRDIENAVLVGQQAVDLTPDGHADKAAWLTSLGKTFLRRFERLGKVRDIENAWAILAHQQAVALTPDHHAKKAKWLSNLGSALQSRFQYVGELRDIMEATVAYKKATENTLSHPFSRYSAACHWAILCSKHQSPSSALDAYTVAMEIIPQLVWFGQTVHRRYEELPGIGRAINAAAAMAISAGDLPRAVEWLEEGRSIVWKQILQLRTPLDELRQQYPDIADELSRISLALDNAGTSYFQNFDLGIKHKSVEDEVQFHRRLAAQYEELLQKVRELDGFGSFLRPKKFSELAPAARNGPVVIINMHDSGCDALVVCPSPPIIHVPLPMFSYGEAAKMHSDLILSLKAGNAREPRQVPPDYDVSSSILKEILGKLWDFVAHPILSAAENILYENIHDSLPHITWCATGTLAFLPLHAAGIYGSDDPTKNMNISDFAVSSYTTTLTAMLGSGSKPKQDLTKTPSVLIVSQPGTGNQFLPSVAKEVEVIQHYTSPDHTCHLTNESATVGAVWGEMSKYEIIHFACHGIQDIKSPLNSAFALYDGRLDLNMLMRLSLENVELAVLSACETATGDKKLPEEAVHLAAGMLAVGYPSIIATMWSIHDPDAPLIADKVYANLLGCHDNSESQKAKLTPAYALHEAVKHLRREVGEMNFVRWVPFIHLGV